MTDWRDDLGAHMTRPKGTIVEPPGTAFGRFLSAVVLPAFEQIGVELARHGRQTAIRHTATAAAIVVQHDGEEEMTYRLEGRTFPGGVLPFADVRYRERKGLRLLRTETMVRSGAPDYQLSDIASDEIIRHFLDQYKKRVRAE